MQDSDRGKRVSVSATSDLALCEILIAEVFDAIARLDAYLDDVESSAQPRSGIPLNLFRNIVRKVLYPSLEQPLGLIKQTATSKTPLNPSEFQAIVNLAGSTFIGLASVHRFLKYLRPPEPPSEIFTLLREIQAAFPDPAIGENEPDVLLSEIFNYGEIDLHAALEWKLREEKIFSAVPGEETIVIILPYTQVNNPLMWTIISHEVGHFAEKQYSLGRKVISKILGCVPADVADSTELDWVEELISDLVAVRVLGPAYLFSFISLTIPQSSLGVPSLTHPSDLSRVRIAFQELNHTCLTDAVPTLKSLVQNSVELFEEKFKFNEKYLGDKNLGPSKIHGKPLADVVALINQELDDLKIARITVDSLRCAETLAKNLAKGHPIAASQSETSVLQSKLAHLEALLADGNIEGSRDLFFEIQNGMVEKPCSCSEIINAGYLHRYEKTIPHIIDRLSASTLDDFANEYRDELKQLDHQLEVSLQTTEIHKLFL
jgi:hypothetical protein